MLKKITISISYLIAVALIILGCVLAKDTTIYFDINGQKLSIHLFICILLTWASILSSVVAIKKFSNDIMKIAEQEEKVLEERKHLPERKGEMLKSTGKYIALPTIIFSCIACRTVYTFNLINV